MMMMRGEQVVNESIFLFISPLLYPLPLVLTADCSNTANCTHVCACVQVAIESDKSLFLSLTVYCCVPLYVLNWLVCRKKRPQWMADGTNGSLPFTVHHEKMCTGVCTSRWRKVTPIPLSSSLLLVAHSVRRNILYTRLRRFVYCMPSLSHSYLSQWERERERERRLMDRSLSVSCCCHCDCKCVTSPSLLYWYLLSGIEGEKYKFHLSSPPLHFVISLSYCASLPPPPCICHLYRENKWKKSHRLHHLMTHHHHLLPSTPPLLM